MALNKTKGYPFNRPFYKVDTNVQWSAGQVAFLVRSGGENVVTTAASGTVPIGTFWKDHELTYRRSTVESGTFDSNDQIQLKHANVRGTSYIKVTDSSGTEYTHGTDYTLNTNNGIVGRVGGGSISASESVIIWYEYTIPADEIGYSGGTNYTQSADDTTGSNRCAIVEGFAHIWTDQYDVTQTYTLSAALRPDANSKWTSATNSYPVCGRVISVPTVSDPWLGVAQIAVASV